MPEDSEMPGNPGDYCLYYWRKCRRRSYPYEVEGEGFSITISEEDIMDVTGSGQKECTKVGRRRRGRESSQVRSMFDLKKALEYF